MVILHEDLCTFMAISCGIPLRMRNISDKLCKENKHTFCIQYIFFPKTVTFMR